MLNNASSIIMFHNHPSGDPTPSKDDIEMTKRLYDVGKLLDIDVLDHVVVGENRFVSLKEQGLI
jgi:DNA repair protein RadC